VFNVENDGLLSRIYTLYHTQ